MARSDWAALVTEPAAEYRASSELARFGLHPYLPQTSRRWSERGACLARRYPLFPGYLLVPVGEVNSPAVRLVHGLCKPRPVLADETGRPWRAPGEVIDALKTAEARGDFDEQALARGDRVRLRSGALAGVEALMETLSGTRAELFVALLGGARVSVAAAKVVRA